MGNLLLDEHPLVILPQLATRVGLHQAVVLQQIHYWVYRNEMSRDPRYVIGGEYCACGTVEWWHDKNFPYLSPHTIRRTFKWLVDADLLVIVSGKAKRRCYRVNYAALERSNDIDNATGCRTGKDNTGQFGHVTPANLDGIIF